jgi:hypothetical protein
MRTISNSVRSKHCSTEHAYGLRYRIPASDVMAYLADRNIRKPELQLIADYVSREWPTVQAVRCGVYVSSGRPHFDIHISPFSTEAQRAHWVVGDWIEATLHTTDSDFFFLPEMEKKEFSSAISVFER